MSLNFLSTQDVVVVGVSALWVVAVWYVYSRKRGSHLPPGPRPLPLVGNVFQVPKENDYVVYAEWAKHYGPIFTLKFLGQRVFVLNSHKVAVDMLEKNMNVYSGRPVNMVMASELIGWGRAVALHAGGPQHQKYRRLLSTSLNSTAVRRYRSVQEQSAQSLLRLLLDDPRDFLKHVRLIVGHSIIEITYGHDLKIQDKDYIDYAEIVGEVFSVAAKPYTFLVDLIPALKWVPRWMPGAKFRKMADRWRHELDELAKAPFDTVKEEIETGEAPDSYVADLLRGPKSSMKSEEQDIMWTAASLYSGGSDTSICALTAFILVMCLNPEKQRAAQKELDEIVGGDRLPTFEDQTNLPYVTALVKEVLRYWTIAPLGIPHRVMKDDVYSDYHIPAGSSVVGNIWGMMHDEEVYSLPFRFVPERFLPKSAGGLEEPDRVSTVFGWGRRTCPGMHLAEASLWIYAANILAVMDILPVKNERGEEVMPHEEGTPGIINFPRPYECNIVPRTPSAAALIAQ